MLLDIVFHICNPTIGEIKTEGIKSSISSSAIFESEAIMNYMRSYLNKVKTNNLT